MTRMTNFFLHMSGTFPNLIGFYLFFCLSLCCLDNALTQIHSFGGYHQDLKWLEISPSLSLSHNSPLFHGKHLYIFLSRQTLKVKANPNTNLTLLCSGKPIFYLLDFSDRSQIPFYSSGLTVGKTYQALQVA